MNLINNEYHQDCMISAYPVRRNEKDLSSEEITPSYYNFRNYISFFQENNINFIPHNSSKSE